MVTAAIDKVDLEVQPRINDGKQVIELVHLPSGLVGFGFDSYCSRKAYNVAMEDLMDRLQSTK